MAQPFLGQIMLVPYNFAPSGWAFCQGQILPISQNAALFSLLGTFYGGNGTSNFALPNLQGAVPIGQGNNPALPPYSMGETGGVQSVTLLTSDMALHTHGHQGAASDASSNDPLGKNFGELTRSEKSWYAAPPAQSSRALMNPASVQVFGGNQPHPNMQPYLVLNYVIALRGEFPSRS